MLADTKIIEASSLHAAKALAKRLFPPERNIDWHMASVTPA
jgi:hypothetical protein